MTRDGDATRGAGDLAAQVERVYRNLATALAEPDLLIEIEAVAVLA